MVMDGLQPDMSGTRTGSDGRPGGDGITSKEYYWIIANYGGRLVVIGPKSTDSEAQSMAYEKLDVPFEIVPLQTRDRSRATSILKARKLEATGNLGQSIQRARHKI